MSPVVAPLFTAERDGFRLRAFAADGDAPAVPWLSVLDLGEAALARRDETVELLVGIGKGWLAPHVRELLTADGPMLVIEHAAAFLMLVVLSSAPEADPSRIATATALLGDAAHGAGMASTPGLPRKAAQRWLAAAWDRDRTTYRSARFHLRPELHP